MLIYPHHRCVTSTIEENKGSSDKNRVLKAIRRDKQLCVDEINRVLTKYPLYCCSVGSVPLAGVDG